MAASGTVQTGRFRALKTTASGPPAEVGPVVYWMFRDQRIRDNWALIHAVDEANRANVPVAVAFNLFDQFLGARARQLGFMLRGLKQLQRDIEETLKIPFFLFQVTFENFRSFHFMGLLASYSDFLQVEVEKVRSAVFCRNMLRQLITQQSQSLPI